MEPIPATPGRRATRGKLARGFVLLALCGFVALAVCAHGAPYFPFDPAISQWVQGIDGPTFAWMMHQVSWLGFFPQAVILSAVVCALLVLRGLRWEAAGVLVAAGGVGLGTLVKLVVNRPRPGADVVRVARQLGESGFPSGHVLEFTCVCGFLVIVAHRRLPPSAARLALVVGLAGMIPLMGLSRIYEGAHWFSDVAGAWLLGSVWLGVTLKFYDWGTR